MSLITRLLSGVNERAIVRFGVILVAIGLLFPPTGLVTVLIREYNLNTTAWAVLIISGMFVKILAHGKLGLRVLGILPFTLYVALANSLWVRGISGLLQSQILYVVIWLILVLPLTRDIISTFINKGGDNAAKTH